MKKLIFSILVILLLLAGSVFLLPLILSSEAAREQFSKRVSSISGMEIALDGPVSFSVFPEFGLVANNVKLASSSGDFSASVTKIVSGVKLASILSGNLEITGFTLRRPEIILDGTKSQNKPVENTQQSVGDKDPFASAVELLEKFSLHRFEITNGKLTSLSANGGKSVVSNINALLKAPSLDGQIQLGFSALRDGQQIESSITLAALRPILKRQSSNVSIALKVSPPPHPALADLSVNGNILLSEDGSYRISNGSLSSLGQPLRLDALYRPGKRPYASVKIEADSVDFGLIEKISGENKNPSSQLETSSKPAGALDLGPLLEMDADVSLIIDRFSMDGAEIRKINLLAALKDGDLKINLGNAEVANGTIAAQVSAGLGEQYPSVQGSLSAVSLGIGNLAKLANVKVPLTGALGLNIGYAFRGLDAKTIRDSFNMAGTVSLSDGVATVAELGKSGLGPSASKISAINAVVEIQHIQKPVDIKARANWNGEAIRINSLITPHSFLKNGSGPLTLSVDSNKLVADYSGNVSTAGALNGSAKISTRSLGGLMAWLGQGNNAGLKGFSYAGNIKLDSKSFSFEKARISLNNINANGAGSLGLKGKPSINTTLAFDTLDIAALTGGNAGNSGAASNGAARGGDTPLDLSALKGFDANIKLSARKIGYGKVTAGPIQTTLVVKNGVARIKLPQAPFYGGTVVADIIADGSKSAAAINADARLAGIDALPLFSDAADFKRLEGKLNANLSVKGSGSTTRTLAKSLAGKAGAQFADGAIRGVDIAKVYNNLTAILAGGFKENSTDKTTFTALGLSFLIDKGVATTNDIKLQGPLVRMDGGGNVDLGEELIDMRLNPRVVASASGQGGDFDVSGLGIPVIIKGPLGKPRVYPDLSELLKNPQAALQSLSKLGLKVKGLDLKALGKGKLDIKKIAADKLGLDKLDKLAGKGTKEKVGQVIGDLITNKNSGDAGASGTGTEKIVGSLVNQLLKPDSEKTQNEGESVDEAPVDEAPKEEEDIVLNITGRIPIPTPNPRRQPAVAAAPKTVQEAVIEKIAPKIKVPVNEDVKKKGIKLLFDNILQ